MMSGFKKAMQKGLILEVTFTQVSEQNQCYSTMIGDVTIVAPFSTFFDAGKKYERFRDSRYLAKPQSVIVSDVDEENRIVTVNRMEARLKKSRILRARIDKVLENKEKYRTKAVVVGYAGKGKNGALLLRIPETNVRGILFSRNWVPGYCGDIRGRVRLGQEVEVDVIRKREQAADREGISYQTWNYECSRTSIIEEELRKKVAESLYPGDIVTVKVLERWGDTSYLGEIVGMPDIYIRVQEPGRRDLQIVPGMKYLCKMRRVDTERFKFTANAFEMLPYEGDPWKEVVMKLAKK